MLGKDMPSNSMQSHEYFPYSSFHLECISDIYIYIYIYHLTFIIPILAN